MKFIELRHSMIAIVRDINVVLEINYEEQLRRFYNVRDDNTFRELVNSSGPRLSLSFQLFSKPHTLFVLPNMVFLMGLVSSPHRLALSLV